MVLDLIIDLKLITYLVKLEVLNLHMRDLYLILPLVLLALFSIFFGFVTKDIFIGLGSGFFAWIIAYLFILLHEIMIDTEFAGSCFI